MGEARHVGIGYQSVFGTQVAPTVFLDVETADFTPVVVRDRASPAHTAADSLGETVEKHYEFDITARVGFEDIHHVLYWIIGSAIVQDSAPSVGLGTHTFPHTTNGYSTRPLLTLEKRTGSVNIRYFDAKVSGVTLTWGDGEGGAMRANIRGIAGDIDTAQSAGTFALATRTPIYRKQLSATLDAASLDLQTGEIAIDWPLDRPFGSGSDTFTVEPTDDDSARTVIVNADVRWPGNLTDFFNDGWNGTDADLALVFTGSNDRSLTLNANKTAVMDGFDPSLEGRARFLNSLVLESHDDGTVVENLQAIVVNDDEDADVPWTT